jgi:hypothetical protein
MHCVTEWGVVTYSCKFTCELLSIKLHLICSTQCSNYSEKKKYAEFDLET